MQAEITFFENTVKTKAANLPKIFQTIKQIHGFRQFIEDGKWDELLPRCEKYINRFSWIIITASVIYLTPVCISIFIR